MLTTYQAAIVIALAMAAMVCLVVTERICPTLVQIAPV